MPITVLWNGTGYSYVTDVSNPGWLGYIGYMNQNGDIVNSGGNPWDYVKLDNNLVATNNGYFDMTLAQQWDELYYLDSAYMMVVDHPVGTDAYTSMTNYLNKGSTGQIYTVNERHSYRLLAPQTRKGKTFYPKSSRKTAVYTPGINGDDSTWNNITQNQLTLDLGNLSAAPAIKLVITGMVDWGSADTLLRLDKPVQRSRCSGNCSQRHTDNAGANHGNQRCQTATGYLLHRIDRYLCHQTTTPEPSR